MCRCALDVFKPLQCAPLLNDCILTSVLRRSELPIKRGNSRVFFEVAAELKLTGSGQGFTVLPVRIFHPTQWIHLVLLFLFSTRVWESITIWIYVDPYGSMMHFVPSVLLLFLFFLQFKVAHFLKNCPNPLCSSMAEVIRLLCGYVVMFYLILVKCCRTHVFRVHHYNGACADTDIPLPYTPVRVLWLQKEQALINLWSNRPLFVFVGHAPHEGDEFPFWEQAGVVTVTAPRWFDPPHSVLTC